MKKIILGLIVPAMLFSWGCATNTTGDPTKGGLFGWSEAKAQARIEEKRRILEEEQRRTKELSAESYDDPSYPPPETTE